MFGRKATQHTRPVQVETKPPDLLEKHRTERFGRAAAEEKGQSMDFRKHIDDEIASLPAIEKLKLDPASGTRLMAAVEALRLWQKKQSESLGEAQTETSEDEFDVDGPLEGERGEEDAAHAIERLYEDASDRMKKLIIHIQARCESPMPERLTALTRITLDLHKIGMARTAEEALMAAVKTTEELGESETRMKLLLKVMEPLAYCEGLHAIILAQAQAMRVMCNALFNKSAEWQNPYIGMAAKSTVFYERFDYLEVFIHHIRKTKGLPRI